MERPHKAGVWNDAPESGEGGAPHPPCPSQRWHMWEMFGGVQDGCPCAGQHWSPWCGDTPRPPQIY